MNETVALGHAPNSTITIMGPHSKPLTLRRLGIDDSVPTRIAEKKQKSVVHLMMEPHIPIAELVTGDGPIPIPKFCEFFEQAGVQDDLFRHFLNPTECSIQFNRLGWKVVSYVHDLPEKSVRAHILFGDPLIVDDISKELMLSRE